MKEKLYTIKKGFQKLFGLFAEKSKQVVFSKAHRGKQTYICIGFQMLKPFAGQLKKNHGAG